MATAASDPVTVDLTDPDVVIAALHASHDRLDALTADLDDLALAQPTRLPGWPVSKVLSHLGSGAEIGLAILRRTERDPAPDRAEMTVVWDRWDARTPVDVRDGRAAADRLHLEALRELDRDRRVPYFVGPLSVAEYAGYRLSEHAVHTWDVAVALDPDARLDPRTVPVLWARLGLIAGRFHDEAARRSLAPTRITMAPTDAEPQLLTVTEAGVVLGPTDGDAVDAAVSGAVESLIRLVYGRLDAGGADVLVGPDLGALFRGY